ncbi:hypothetical protein Tco_0238857 [Tanacetum coccineum]
MLTDKNCPRGEIKKLEIEMWNLKVKGTDVVSYNQYFQELALMCERMFPEESDKVKKKLDNDNQAQQQSPKKPNVARAYYAGSSENKSLMGLYHCATSASFTTMARAL